MVKQQWATCWQVSNRKFLKTDTPFWRNIAELKMPKFQRSRWNPSQTEPTQTRPNNGKQEGINHRHILPQTNLNTFTNFCESNWDTSKLDEVKMKKAEPLKFQFSCKKTGSILFLSYVNFLFRIKTRKPVTARKTNRIVLYVPNYTTVRRFYGQREVIHTSPKFLLFLRRPPCHTLPPFRKNGILVIFL